MKLPLAVVVSEAGKRRHDCWPHILWRDDLKIVLAHRREDLIGLDVVLVNEDQKTHPLYQEALVRLKSRIGNK